MGEFNPKSDSYKGGCSYVTNRRHSKNLDEVQQFPDGALQKKYFRRTLLKIIVALILIIINRSRTHS